jgi:hypothetical protein
MFFTIQSKLRASKIDDSLIAEDGSLMISCVPDIAELVANCVFRDGDVPRKTTLGATLYRAQCPDRTAGRSAAAAGNNRG